MIKDEHKNVQIKSRMQPKFQSLTERGYVQVIVFTDDPEVAARLEETEPDIQAVVEDYVGRVCTVHDCTD